MTVNKNDLVYHYCSVDTFLSIIQNSKLWLSDILKSNDAQEYFWVRDKINSEVKSKLLKDAKAFQIWEKFQAFGKEIAGKVNYTCSFSECRDSLSQWRGYAQDGEGVAIGFSKTHLQVLNDLTQPFLTFDKVVYDERKLRRLIESNSNKIIKIIDLKGVGRSAMELDGHYNPNYLLYKNPSFKQENEWRIIFLSPIRKEKSDYLLGGFQFHESKFRSVNGKIISYVEMNFEHIKQQLIKEIYIGPKAKVSQEDIKSVLFMNGYYDGFDPDTGMPIEFGSEKPISIRHSSSTYQ